MRNQVGQFLTVRTRWCVDNEDVGIARRVAKTVPEAHNSGYFRPLGRPPIKPVETRTLRVVISQRNDCAFVCKVGCYVCSEGAFPATTLRIHNHYVPHDALQGQCC